MKRIILHLLLCIAINCFSTSIAQAYIVDTGPGPDSLAGYIFQESGGSHAFAGEFTLTQPATITEIMGWMAVYTSGELLGTIRTDGGEVPGDLLYSKVFTAPQSVFSDSSGVTYPPWGIWSGPQGLNWNLGPGTYWVGFELVQGSGYQAIWPHDSLSPLGNEAFSTDIFNLGYNFEGDGLNIGVRIDGSIVPLPGSLLLVGSGLLGLAGLRRFRKN